MPQAMALAKNRRAVRLTAMFFLHVNGLVSSAKQDPRPSVPVTNCGCRRLAHRSKCLLNETRGSGTPDDGFVFSLFLFVIVLSFIVVLLCYQWVVMPLFVLSFSILTITTR